MVDFGQVSVRLQKPLRRTLRRGHPWVFRDAISRLTVAPGTVVTIVDDRNRFIARGWADEGPIAIRVVTNQDVSVDAKLVERRVHEAAALRDRVVPPSTNTYRLLHGEGDRLPGIVCDVYADYATLKLDGAAALTWREVVMAALVPVLQERGVKGLVLRTGRRGHKRVEGAWGGYPPNEVVVEEQGVRLSVDLIAGQKTGMFIDHRPSRRQVRRIAGDLHVLDLYSYIGGFSASAGLGGAASVTTVDVAGGAIKAAGRTWAANGLSEDKQQRITADVPEFLETQRQAKGRYGLIISDPPSFAPNQGARTAALAAYTKLHRAAVELLAPHGYLLAASCSSHIDRRDFEDTLIEGADNARRNLQVLDRWGAPPDHPRLLCFPEGDYLKVILARVLD